MFKQNNNRRKFQTITVYCTTERLAKVMEWLSNGQIAEYEVDYQAVTTTPQGGTQ